MTRVDLSAPVSLADLLRHCKVHGPDRFIAEGFAAVLDCAASEADREALARYRRARMKAPGWSPGSYTSNNHARIAADVLAGLIESGNSVSEQPCDPCGRRFIARRSDARSCSSRCRQRRRRSRSIRRVTAESR